MNIQETENKYFLPVYGKRDISLVRGEGVYLFDENNKKYLDFMSNYGANLLGHANPHVTEAIRDQLGILTNTHGSFCNDARAKFLAKLHSITPLDYTFLSSTGTESVEAAIKFAKTATGRNGFISAKMAYHGRTLGSLSATASSKHQQQYLPLLPGFVHVPYNSVTAIEEALDKKIAAVILEPIQGEGGVNVPDENYLSAVKKLCEENGSLLILDEVQTGLRTGNWLASTHFNVAPDIFTMSKGLGNGFPVAVTCVSKSVAEKIPKGSHGTTFGGNPVACRAALATLEEIEKNNLHAHVREIGAYLLEQLKEIKSPMIREARGLGLMVAVELKQKAGNYVKLMQDAGLLTMNTGNVIRLLPPIVITKEEVNEGLSIIEATLNSQE
ncbi:MAG: acetylornithine/succinylornithine family transaminase [Patescibacteria group bacterium]